MYTAQDLKNIEEAIEKLQLGKRVVSVSYGNHIVKYADINLSDLLKLRRQIKDELKLTDRDNPKKRRMHFSTHKGIS